MNLFKNFFLLGSLTALSLVACAHAYQCADEQCQIDTQTDESANAQDSTFADLVRVEIEVVGGGAVVVEEPVAIRCTGDIGLCSFSYARGTKLVLHADGEFGDELGWEDACEGFGPCKITLDYDQVVVANFKPSIAEAERLIRVPGKPQIIVDRVPTSPESAFHQEVPSDDSFTMN